MIIDAHEHVIRPKKDQKHLAEEAGIDISSYSALLSIRSRLLICPVCHGN